MLVATRALCFLLTLSAQFIPATQQAMGPGQAAGSATNPHGPLRVSCESCHTANAWRPLKRPVDFDHNRATGFPLLHAHRQVACAGCHRDLRFAHVPSACADCHTDPHRGEMGHDCERCHTSAGWESRNNLFEIHSRALFPLTGAHVSVDCASCHRDAPERYLGAPTRCFACHEDDYQQATPSHAGFPRECETCHTTSRFEGASFPDHERIFPIATGPHAGAWNSCADCHPSPASFRIFTCISCHAHNREEMDDKHEDDDDVVGYRYESTACLACHPQGHQ